MRLSTTGVAGSVAAYASTKADTTKKTSEVEDTTAKATTTSEETETGVVYEKSSEESQKATYSINKMSAEDRAALVKQLQADQESRQNQLVDIVKQMMLGLGKTFNQANDIWSFLASGEYTVDEAAKAQAQEDISEDGYWGVKQTSQRLFDFACALAGDDVDKMKEMQAAMEKGFGQATEAWGKDLPSICQDTLDAANKLFDDYYASKSETTEATAE